MQCCIPDCQRVGPAPRSARFPVKRPQMLKLWLENINLPSFKGKTLKQLFRYRICAKHFEPHFLDKDWDKKVFTRIVKPGGYPTLHLKPLSAAEIYNQKSKNKKCTVATNSVSNTTYRDTEPALPNVENLKLEEETVATVFSNFDPNDDTLITEVARTNTDGVKRQNLLFQCENCPRKFRKENLFLWHKKWHDSNDDTLISNINPLHTSFASKGDKEVVIENIGYDVLHNYSENKSKSIQTESENTKQAKTDNTTSEEGTEKKSELQHLKYFEILDPGKTFVIDYVNGQIVCKYFDKPKTETIEPILFDQNEPAKPPQCCLCLQDNIDITSFFQIDGQEEKSYATKMKETFPDLEIDYDELSSTICPFCVESLNSAYEFHKKIREAQKKIEKPPKVTQEPIPDFENIDIFENIFNDQDNQNQDDSNDTSENFPRSISPTKLLEEPGIKKQTIQKKGSSNKFIKDILSTLNGIVITKTKTNQNTTLKSPYIYRCNLCSIKFNDIVKLYQHKLFNHGQETHRHQILNRVKNKRNIPTKNQNQIQNQNSTIESNDLIQNQNLNLESNNLIQNQNLTIEEKNLIPETFDDENLSSTNEYLFLTNENIRMTHAYAKIEENTPSVNTNISSNQNAAPGNSQDIENVTLTNENLASVNKNMIVSRKVVSRTKIAPKSKVLKSEIRTLKNGIRYIYKEILGPTVEDAGINMDEAKRENIYLQCENCPRKFRNENLFMQHKKWHEGVKDYCCEKCGQQFFFNHQLKEHMEGHSETPNYYCKTCGKGFKRKRNLLQHEVIHPEASIMCHICGIYVKTNAHLKNHMKIHTDEKPFNCKYCPSKFKRKNELSAHTRTHTNEKPYKCTQCDEAYSNSTGLKHHLIREHIKVKNFKCPLCDKRFYIKKNMNNHRLTHLEQPVMCNICHKILKHPRTLERHIKVVHENRRNHECNICLKRFREPGVLKKHMEKIHNPEKNNLSINLERERVRKSKGKRPPTEMYQCSHCKRHFENLDQYEMHDCNMGNMKQESESSDDSSDYRFGYH